MQKKYDFTPAQPICQEIDRLLVSSKSPVIVAIDGVCGGGKTTLGEWLAMQYDCNLFHMDDFFWIISSTFLTFSTLVLFHLLFLVLFLSAFLLCFFLIFLFLPLKSAK